MRTEGQTYRQTDMTKLIAVFRYFANSPKKQTDATLSQRCPFQLHAIVSVRNSKRTTLRIRSYDNGQPSHTPRQCTTMDSPFSHPDSAQQWTALSHTQTVHNNGQPSLTPRQCTTMDSHLSHPDSAQRAYAVFDIAERTVTASLRSTVRADNTLLPIPYLPQVASYLRLLLFLS